MSNLSVYNGNFLNYADREFQGSSDYRKAFSGIYFIDLNVGCDVGIFPSANGQTTVEIDSDEPNDFTVKTDGDTLVIKQKSVSNGGSVVINGNGVSINGMSFSGNNVVMNNGRVYVDGKEVTPGSSKPTKKAKIKIFTAQNVDLSANLNGSGVLASKVAFNRVNIKVSGQATVGLAAKSLKLKLSGQGDNYAVLRGGSLTANVSGQGSVRIKGEYDSADLSVFGMGNIITDGICTGDYDASVSGMGSITHTGKINGRKRKSVTGMGSISI